ncbi:MAG: M48 family metallopeptidase [Solobacterium sp.]|nr:M48 family metallopeptidase [Solobacterium sp.]
MIDANFYMHEDDKKALDALKSFPGFTAIIKGFFNNWNERQARILFMSSYIKASPTQFSKYYEMLPPICKKLGIEIPDLYISQDVVPNAFTTGDEHPSVVLTSGLLKALPEYLIPTVLAHECGHIACKHVLYRTVGASILAGTYLFGLGRLMSLPLQVAFYYWMRCSEYSADRAAIICDGGSEKLNELCIRLSGYDKAIDADVSPEEFRNQGLAYRKYIKESKWNQTLEFLLLHNRTHPFMAVRALEATEWANSIQFKAMMGK